MIPRARTGTTAGLAVRRVGARRRACRPRRAATTDFDAPFQELITEAAWGHVWSRPDWTKRERSMVTIALLAALGHDEEVAMHVRATANTGATARGHPRGAAACRDLCRRAGRQPRHQDRQEGLRRDGCQGRQADDRLELPSNRAPETGAFFQRDRDWHPPAFTPGYKTSVLRSPQQALLSLDNTLSEITGPVFGHDMLGELDNDLIHNFARPGESAIGPRIIVYGRVLDERGSGGAGRAARVLAGQCRRPLPPQEGGLPRRRSTRISAAAAARSPARTAPTRFRTIQPGPYPWPNGANDWRPAHIHFSVFGHGFAQRLITQMYFEGDPMIWKCPIVATITDRAAIERLIAALDMAGDDPDGCARLQVRHRAARPPLDAVREPAGGQLMAQRLDRLKESAVADRRALRPYRPDAEFLPASTASMPATSAPRWSTTRPRASASRSRSASSTAPARR